MGRAIRDIFADVLILRGFCVVCVHELDIWLAHPNVPTLKYVIVTDDNCFLLQHWDDQEFNDCITVKLYCGYIEGQANGLCDMFGV